MLDTLTPAPSAPSPDACEGGLAAEPFASLPRGVVPRRPLRLAPPRDEAAPDPRQPLVALNIFADAFDVATPADPQAGIDPRIIASRRRARRRLAASADDLAPDESNFWHPSLCNSETPQVQSHMPATHRAADRATAPANDVPDIPLPLHEHLARVRHALYAAGPENPPQAPVPLSAQMRLAACAMNATLVVIALPVGAAVTTYSVLRGSDIRLSAQAIAIVASVLGIWQSGLDRLL